MGWLFGHYERRSLIEHLVNGNGLKTVKHCLVGNNLWCVHEREEQVGTRAVESDDPVNYRIDWDSMEMVAVNNETATAPGS